MTHDQWTSVIQPKVAGAWNFHHALLSASQSVDFFILLSSAAGAVGNRGQAAYAAANCFLNAFAQYRHHLNLPASSIDLTAVSDAGYLLESSGERQKEVMDNLGSESISEVEVLALIGAAITGKMNTSCNNHCITGLKIAPEKINDIFWTSDAKFSYLHEAAEKEASALNSNTSSSTANISINTAVKNAASKAQAIELITEALVGKISAVLMVPREEMDPMKPIVVYGLDSLVAIEIRNWITRELEASLQVLELLTAGSFKALAETVLGKSRLGGRFVEGAAVEEK